MAECLLVGPDRAQPPKNKVTVSKCAECLLAHETRSKGTALQVWLEAIGTGR